MSFTRRKPALLTWPTVPFFIHHLQPLTPDLGLPLHALPEAVLPRPPRVHCRAHCLVLGLSLVRCDRSPDAALCPLWDALCFLAWETPLPPGSCPARRPLFLVSCVDRPRSGPRPDVRVPGVWGQRPARPRRGLSFCAFFISRDVASAWSFSPDRRRTHSPARGSAVRLFQTLRIPPPPPTPGRPDTSFFPSHISTSPVRT